MSIIIMSLMTANFIGNENSKVYVLLSRKRK